MIYRKYFLITLFFLISFSFLSFIDFAEAGQFGKGWYKDAVFSGTTCQEEEWQAKIDFFNTQNNPLLADLIQINVVLWSDTTGDGKWDSPNHFYSNNFYNTQSVEVCMSFVGSNQDMMVLIATVSKDGYKRIQTHQKGIKAGDDLRGNKWTRQIYLARNEEPVNVAHRFPVNNQALTNTEISFQVDVSLRPESNNVSELILEIINETTNQSFENSFIPTQQMIDEGTIIFPTEQFPEGKYRWRIKILKDNNNFIYDNIGYDQFIIDLTPPVITSMSRSWVSGERMRFGGTANDQGSGLRKIEVYFENEIIKTCFFYGSVLSNTCQEYITFDPHLEEGTYTYKVVAEDMAGWQHEMTESFEIKKTRLRINIRTYTDRDEYKYEQITVRHISGYDSPGEHTTPYAIVSDGAFDVELEFPYKIKDENGPHYYNLSRGGGHSILSLPDCTDTDTTCRMTIRVESGADSLIRILFSDQIKIYAIAGGVYTEGILIKKIEGIMGDFEEGETHIEKTIHGPIDAVIEAPKSIEARGEEWLFDYWRGTYLRPCNEVFGPDNRYCRIIEDPYKERQLFAHYKRYPFQLEVYSYVDGVEKEGARIDRVSGNLGSGGITNYIFEQQNNAIDTVIRASIQHEGLGFANWAGCDHHSISDRTCEVAVNTRNVSRKIVVNYGLGAAVDPSESYTLYVKKDGNGEGTVSSNPSGINCGPTCNYTFFSGSIVTLEAQEEQGSLFIGWSGEGAENCLGATCEISMTVDREITAIFGILANILNVQSSPLPGVSIDSTQEGTEGTTDYKIEKSGEINTWLTAPLNTTLNGKNYAFDSWSNCTQDGTNPRNCGVILKDGQELTVTANYNLAQDPTAAISCQVDNCYGLGCHCNSGVWQTYPKAVFQVKNDSPDPENSINKSIWTIRNDQEQTVSERTYNEKRDWGEFGLPIGNYVIELTVENETGPSDPAFQQIKVKDDINVNFECSLDGEEWHGNCADLTVSKDDEIYLKDVSVGSELITGERADISFREWRLNGIVIGSDQIITAVIAGGDNVINLNARDTVGRTDSATQETRAKMKLPEWKEIPPL